MRKPVTNKIDMYDRWIKGEFGNRLNVWQTLEELGNSGYEGKIGLRYKVPGSSFCRYNVSLTHLDSVIEEFVNRGADPRLFTYGEMAPDQKILMQGEMVLMPQGLHLIYSYYKAQMRDALSIEPRWARGGEAVELIRYYANPASLDDLKELLINYPDHTIEFSCYSCCLGSCNHRNTLIWEVRNY